VAAVTLFRCVFIWVCLVVGCGAFVDLWMCGCELCV